MRMTAIAIGELVLALLAAPAFAQSGASGSQYQVETFTGTNAASGNANLLTDAYDDFLVPSGHLEISTGAYGFSLGIRDPNGDLTVAVPTFRATTSNAITALDVLPNGTATDNGWGAAYGLTSATATLPTIISTRTPVVFIWALEAMVKLILEKTATEMRG